MSGLFGSSTGSGFGSNTQQQPANPFGSSTTNQTKPNLFGSLNTNTSTSQPQPSGGVFGNTGGNTQQSGGIFGSSTQSQPQQSGGLFGSSTQSQPQQTGGVFGSSTQAQPQQQQGSGLFGSLGQTSQPQQGSGVFGSSSAQQQPQQQGGGLFGGFGTSTNPQPSQQQPGGGLFGNLGQNNQQQQQVQQQGNLLGQSQQNRIWTEQDIAPRQKSVTDQIDLVYHKWDPQSQNSLFHTYLYNTVNPDTAPFYRPDPSDNEEKWEEALRKRPNPGAIPVLVKGFEQLGHRIVSQEEHLKVLHGRVYEINNGLTDLLRRHDLDISTRTTECRRRHNRISQKCLALATKVQVLRNRGYAMDSAEEELRQKLLVLERSVFDPALNGRGEEIWARMVSVRERGRQLQLEFERAGRNMIQDQGQGIDEEVMKRAKKILEDYNSQLSHLTKELAQIQSDYEEWERSKPAANGSGRGR
ncbi:hypothetical protein MMC24_002176 [Lignoscripta atroalba]|nr:hypothetical protein [Lignoscripta atroalba]